MLKVKALSPKVGKEIPFPSYATPGSAGMDLRACLDAPLRIPGRFEAESGADNFAAVPTGIAIQLPGPGCAAFLFARSGLAAKYGLTLSNGVGVIDSDYRGEIKVALTNHGRESYTIQPGERIAQLVVLPVEQMELAIVDELDATSRGAGGFGSTGRE